jgi:hypothetical protein
MTPARGQLIQFCGAASDESDYKPVAVLGLAGIPVRSLSARAGNLGDDVFDLSSVVTIMSALLIYVLEGTLGIAVLVFVAAFLGGVVVRARRRRKNRA